MENAKTSEREAFQFRAGSRTGDKAVGVSPEQLAALRLFCMIMIIIIIRVQSGFP